MYYGKRFIIITIIIIIINIIIFIIMPLVLNSQGR